LLLLSHVNITAFGLRARGALAVVFPRAPFCFIALGFLPGCIHSSGVHSVRIPDNYARCISVGGIFATRISGRFHPRSTFPTSSLTAATQSHRSRLRAFEMPSSRGDHRSGFQSAEPLIATQRANLKQS
jgi:hypothetical protein